MFGILYKGQAVGLKKLEGMGGHGTHKWFVIGWACPTYHNRANGCKRGSGERAGMPTHLAQTDVNEVAGDLPATLSLGGHIRPPSPHQLLPLLLRVVDEALSW